MMRSFLFLTVVAFTGCTSGDFKLVDNNTGSSLNVAKGGTDTRTFTLTAEGHYLNTKFNVTGSAGDSSITATPSATQVDTGSGGSVDITLEVAVPANFSSTLSSATLRVQDVNDAQSFASDSFTINIQ